MLGHHHWIYHGIILTCSLKFYAHQWWSVLLVRKRNPSSVLVSSSLSISICNSFHTSAILQLISKSGHCQSPTKTDTQTGAITKKEINLQVLEQNSSCHAHEQWCICWAFHLLQETTTLFWLSVCCSSDDPCLKSSHPPPSEMTASTFIKGPCTPTAQVPLIHLGYLKATANLYAIAFNIALKNISSVVFRVCVSVFKHIFFSYILYECVRKESETCCDRKNETCNVSLI